MQAGWLVSCSLGMEKMSSIQYCMYVRACGCMMVCVAWGCVGVRINFGCECMHVACMLDVALILACVCGYSVLCCSRTF